MQIEQSTEDVPVVLLSEYEARYQNLLRGVNIFTQALKALAVPRADTQDTSHNGGSLGSPPGTKRSYGFDKKRRLRGKKYLRSRDSGSGVAKHKKSKAVNDGSPPPSHFWSYVEGFFRDIEIEDVEMLVPLCNYMDDNCFTVPSLGEIYTNVWAADDSTAASRAAVAATKASVTRVKRKLLTASPVIKIRDTDGAASRGAQMSVSPALTTVISPPENDDDELCHVCFSGECSDRNQILFCDSCNVAVHQDCYGVKQVPDGQWLCSVCSRDLTFSKLCALCPLQGGALKPTAPSPATTMVPPSSDGISADCQNGEKFAHLFCCQWIPETYIENTDTMEPIRNLEEIDKERLKLLCVLCKMKQGCCIQCSHAKCATAFHPLCAREAKYRMEVSWREDGDEVYLRAFCPKHSSVKPLALASDSKPEGSVENATETPVGPTAQVEVDVGGTAKTVQRSSGSPELTDSNAVARASGGSVQERTTGALPALLGRGSGQGRSRETVDKKKMGVASVRSSNGHFATATAESAPSPAVAPVVASKDLLSRLAEKLETLGTMDLVSLVKQIMADTHTTQTAIAAQSGVSQSMLSTWLQGKERPSQAALNGKIRTWMRGHHQLLIAKKLSVHEMAEDVSLEINEGIPINSEEANAGDAFQSDLGGSKEGPGILGGAAGIEVHEPAQSAVLIRGKKAPGKASTGEGRMIMKKQRDQGPLLSSDPPSTPCQVPQQAEQSDTRGIHPYMAAILKLHSPNLTQAPRQECPGVSMAASEAGPSAHSQFEIASNPRSQEELAAAAVEVEFSPRPVLPLEEETGRPAPKQHTSPAGDNSSSSQGHPVLYPLSLSTLAGETSEHTDASLVTSSRQGTLQRLISLAPEDEIVGELLILQKQLLLSLEANRIRCERVLQKVVPKLWEQRQAQRLHDDDMADVALYLSQQRDMKKAGRKEKRDKEAQALLAAATAAAAASPRVGVSRRESGVEEDLASAPAVVSLTPIADVSFPNARLSRPALARPPRHPSIIPVPLRPEASEPPTPAALEEPGIAGRSAEHEALCAVCNNGDSERPNRIVFCERCGVAVHQECYGVARIPLGPWLCQPCVEMQRVALARASPVPPIQRDARGEGMPGVQCLLCPGRTGALKQSTEGRWVHVFCAQWMPEVRIGAEEDSLVEGLDTISEDRFRLRCMVCDDPHGACLHCNYGHCSGAFHVTCARSSGLFLSVRAGPGGRLQRRAYCLRHSAMQRAKTSTEGRPRSGTQHMAFLKRTRMDLERLRLICERVIRREKLKRELLQCSRDLTTAQLAAAARGVFPGVCASSGFRPLQRSPSQALRWAAHGHAYGHGSARTAHALAPGACTSSPLSGGGSWEEGGGTQEHLRKKRRAFVSPHLSTQAAMSLPPNSHAHFQKVLQPERMMTSMQANEQNRLLPKGFQWIPLHQLPPSLSDATDDVIGFVSDDLQQPLESRGSELPYSCLSQPSHLNP